MDPSSPPSLVIATAVRSLLWSLVVYPSAALLGIVLAWVVMLGTVVVGIATHGILSTIQNLPLWVLLFLWVQSYGLLVALVATAVWLKTFHSQTFPWWMLIYVLANPGPFIYSHPAHCLVYSPLTLQDYVRPTLVGPISTMLFAFAATLILFALRNVIIRPANRALLGPVTGLGLGWAVFLLATDFNAMATSLACLVLLGLGFLLAPLPFTIRHPARFSVKACHHMLMVFLQIIAASLLVFALSNTWAFITSPSQIHEVWQLHAM